MSRVTAPIAKVVKGTTGSPSLLVAQAVHSRRLAENTQSQSLLQTDKSAVQTPSSSSSFTTTTTTTPPDPTHRPRISATTAAPRSHGFRSSAVRSAAHDSSTMDFFFLPDVSRTHATETQMRVPILPDTYAPNRTFFAPEQTDIELPRAEICVVASHPENVAPVAMSEVVGNEALDEISLHLPRPRQQHQQQQETQPGLLRGLWNGLVEDVQGAGGSVGIGRG